MTKKTNTVMKWDDDQAKKISDHAVAVFKTRTLNDLFSPRMGFDQNPDNCDEKGIVKQHVWISEEKIDGEKQVVINIWHKPISRRPDEEIMKDPDYWFEYKRCNTAKKLCDWIYHLVGKNWCTVALIDELMEKVGAVYLYKTGEVMYEGTSENDGFEKEHCRKPR